MGVTAGCTALVLGASAGTAPLVLAEEAPQQALQAVTVELGTDGSITSWRHDGRGRVRPGPPGSDAGEPTG